MFRKVSAGMGNDPGIRNQLSARRKALRDKLGGRPVAAVGMGLDSQWGRHAARAALSPAAPGGARAQRTPQPVTGLRRNLSPRPDSCFRLPARWRHALIQKAARSRSSCQQLVLRARTASSAADKDPSNVAPFARRAAGARTAPPSHSPDSGAKPALLPYASAADLLNLRRKALQTRRARTHRQRSSRHPLIAAASSSSCPHAESACRRSWRCLAARGWPPQARKLVTPWNVRPLRG